MGSSHTSLGLFFFGRFGGSKYLLRRRLDPWGMFGMRGFGSELMSELMSFHYKVGPHQLEVRAHKSTYTGYKSSYPFTRPFIGCQGPTFYPVMHSIHLGPSPWGSARFAVLGFSPWCFLMGKNIWPLCSLLPSAVVVLARGLNGYLNTEPNRVFGSL